MNKESPSFKKICAHIAFCIAVIVFFGRNTLLRTVACGALYKEYIVGLMVLVLFYLDMFILYPWLFLKELKITYLFVVTFCSLAFAGIELLFVYPQIKGILAKTFLPKEISMILRHYIFFMFLRNLGFILFAHAISNINHLSRLKEKYEIRLRETAHELQIPVGTSASITLNVDDILYCQQARNKTWIYPENKRSVVLYGSLKKMAKILGENDFFYASRDVIVNRNKVHSYNNESVVIKNEKTNESTTLKWTSFYYECFQLSQPTDVYIKSLQTTTRPKAGETTQMSTTEVRRTKNGFIQKRVYHYILLHPGCKTSDLSKRIKMSSATVNRILAQLKKDGLIEYTGSKKTGGYQVVKERQ